MKFDANPGTFVAIGCHPASGKKAIDLLKQYENIRGGGNDRLARGIVTCPTCNNVHKEFRDSNVKSFVCKDITYIRVKK